MSNEKVIRAFLRKEVAKTPLRTLSPYYGGGRVRTLEVVKLNSEDGDVVDLINYSTKIASIVNNVLYINNQKYSSTTSHIQSMIRRLSEEYGYSDIRELKLEV